MSQNKDGKNENKKPAWKVDPSLTMEIKKGADWKSDRNLTMTLKESCDKKESKKQK